MTPLGWHVIQWDGSRTIVHTSRTTRFVDIPDHVIALIQVFTEAYGRGVHLRSKVCYGTDWIWLASNGIFSAGSNRPGRGEVAKPGLLLPIATYEPIRVRVHQLALRLVSGW